MPCFIYYDKDVVQQNTRTISCMEAFKSACLSALYTLPVSGLVKEAI